MWRPDVRRPRAADAGAARARLRGVLGAADAGFASRTGGPQHRTARKRADRAKRLGYRFSLIRRQQHVDDDLRDQHFAAGAAGPADEPPATGSGRRDTADPVYTCPRHAIKRYGVLDRRHARRLPVAVPRRRARPGLADPRPRRAPRRTTSCTCSSQRRHRTRDPARRLARLQPARLRHRRAALLQGHAAASSRWRSSWTP